MVHLYDELKNLPKECSVIVQHDGNEVKVYDKNDISGQYLSCTEDRIMNMNEMELAKSMANVQLDYTNANYSLPEMLTFLDMFEVGKVEHLNALTRWQEMIRLVHLKHLLGLIHRAKSFT